MIRSRSVIFFWGISVSGNLEKNRRTNRLEWNKSRPILAIQIEGKNRQNYMFEMSVAYISSLRPVKSRPILASRIEGKNSQFEMYVADKSSLKPVKSRPI